MEKSEFDMEAELLPEVERVAQLMTRFVFGAMSTGEVMSLHQWMSATASNRALFLSLMQPAALVQGQIFFRQHTADVRRRRALLSKIKQQASIPGLPEEGPYLHWWLRLATGFI